MTQPNVDLWQAGASLQGYIAQNLTAALQHIARELSALDGFPERGDQLSVRASAEMTSVERHAEGRWALTNAREDLRDRKAAALLSIRELNEAINEAMRLRAPRDVTQPNKNQGLCCSNQLGLHAVIEWGDALCLRLPVKKGLCEKHWKAYYRACERDGVDRTKDYEPCQT